MKLERVDYYLRQKLEYTPPRLDLNFTEWVHG
jgi:hypothetical protein